MEIRHTYTKGLPVLVVPNRYPGAGNIFGAIDDSENSRYLFPAFPPFRDAMVSALSEIGLDLHAQTRAELYKGPTFDDWLHTVHQAALPIKSMEHQLVGLAELLYNYRWALQWEMGTGKSKVVVDALGFLQEKALILCPLVALQNWKDEIDKHSGGSLKVVMFDGKSTQKKKQQLQDALQADVFLCTYDSARLYGVPTLYSSTVSLFNKASMVPNIKLREALMDLNDEKKQLLFAEQLIQRRPNAEVLADIKAITQASPTCIEHLPYTVIVADECHRIKNFLSKRTRYCLQLSAKARRRYELSGTFAPGGDPRDVYPQLRFLAPYLMPEDWTKFCKNHCVTRPGNKHIVVQFKNLDVINKRVTSVSSTRKLDDCVDLPERTFSEVHYQLSKEQTIDYDRAATDFKIWHAKAGDEIDIAHSAIAIAKLLQICSGFVYVPELPDMSQLFDSQDVHLKMPAPGREAQRYAVNPKLNVTMDLLEDLVRNQQGKVLVWAHYLAELDDIEAALQAASYNYVRADGATSGHVKKLVDEFQNNPSCQIYLAQESTGIAITLTAARYSIYYSRSWSLEARLQSLFRNYRIGQKQKTVVYDMVAAGSMEEQQRYALINKLKISDLLTQRPNCLVCKYYGVCLVEGTKPWDSQCVLPKDPKRVVTKPSPLK